MQGIVNGPQGIQHDHHFQRLKIMRLSAICHNRDTILVKGFQNRVISSSSRGQESDLFKGHFFYPMKA